MHGARRVVTFCLLMAVLPTVLLIIPLYLRHSIFADVTFKVAESDVLEIVDGISNIFCQEHILRMNSSFDAIQLRNVPPTLSTNLKNSKLKKNFILPDDTVEYWGFYLPKGSRLILSVCARYAGTHILVVKGEQNFRSCGLREHAPVKEFKIDIQEADDHIKVHSFQHHSVTMIANNISTEPHIREQFGGDTESGKTLNGNNAKESTDENEDNARESTDDNDDDTEIDDNARDSTDDIEDNSLEDDGNDDEGEVNDSEINKHEQFLATHLQKVFPTNQSGYSNNENQSYSDTFSIRKVRHPNSKNQKLKLRRSNVTDGNKNTNRFKRNVRVIYAGVGHGGTANNATKTDDPESSASSFENNLLTCYAGKVLLNHEIDPSHTCSSSSVLDNTLIVKTEQNVSHDGYYYYIFFSDNDLHPNRVHALFDILKPTYLNTTYPNTNRCINQTECKFSLPFWSYEAVIVEVPTRDGFEHEDNEFTYLVSSCYPRMAVYIIFPITVLFIILGCAFL